MNRNWNNSFFFKVFFALYKKFFIFCINFWITFRKNTWFNICHINLQKIIIKSITCFITCSRITFICIVLLMIILILQITL